MWGQDSILRLSFRLFLIIPTRVGTRQQRHNSRHRRTDHPHAYGDKLRGYCLVLSSMGSSPRVWGQVYPRFPDIYKGRDHPHACGDKSQSVQVNVSTTGSSPRVWGQDYRLRRYTITYGIIPTRVGTSSLNNKAYFNKVGSSPRVWGQARKHISE